LEYLVISGCWVNLGVITFTQPLTKLVSDDVIYEHQGDFNYYAPDTAGIYDSAKIKTGDPVFTNLNCIVNTEFSYRFLSPRLSESEEKSLQGNYRVLAELSDIDGWTRTFLLVSKTSFSGSGFDDWTLLDVCNIQSLILDKEEKTGTVNPVYFLKINPDIYIEGLVTNKSLRDTYQPEIVFQIDSKIDAPA
jgi:hypothetical protein